MSRPAASPESGAPPARSSSLRTELGAAALVWAVTTAVVVAAAPAVVALPLVATAGPVALPCALLGRTVARALRPRLAPAAGGVRLGAAVVVLGQLLDVLLVVALGGTYPRLDAAGTAEIATLLLSGYAGFLAGAASVDARRPVGPVGAAE